MKEIKAKEQSTRIAFKSDDDVEILVSAYTWQRMRYLVDSVDSEVAWLGTVERTDNTFKITEIYVPTQEVTTASVNADAEMMSDLIPDLIEEHGEEEALNNIIPNLRAFCHSHHKMKTFWSATDENGINGLANSQFLVSLVLNQDGEVLGRVDIFEPMRITIDNVPLRVDFGADFDDLKKEIKEKVKKATYTPKKPNKFSNSGYGGYGGYNNPYGSGYDPLDDDFVEWGSARDLRPIVEGEMITKAFSLPPKIMKADPELKELCQLVLRSHSKPNAIRDLAFLIFAANHENNQLMKRKDELSEIINDVINSKENVLMKPALLFEIIGVANSFGELDKLKDKDPNVAMKSCSPDSVVRKLKFMYGIEASDTYCIGL
jgi:hypothetical protein